MDGAVELDKTVDWHTRAWPAAICNARDPARRFPGAQGTAATGDIVGFVTRRPKLDYFHIGFIVFGDDGELLLRHAARAGTACSTNAWTRFLAANRVRYVTLLRPQEPWADAAMA